MEETEEKTEEETEVKTKVKKHKINKTQLYVKDEMQHADYFAHWLRWQHVLKFITKKAAIDTKAGDLRTNKILDIGCGDLPLLRTLFVNKYQGTIEYYLGLDARDLADKIANDSRLPKKVDWDFAQFDCREPLPFGNNWSIITCFEVLEHMDKEDGIKMINNIVNSMNPETTLFLSTPSACDNLPANHIYEWGFAELKEQLEKQFKIQAVYGTFGGVMDIKKIMTETERDIYERLREYYHNSLLSIIFAPLFPEQARACLWKCTLA
jgi:2-polyprenyl-3-methyl-5-hydroxy-6-metoxy-1,4-benzoquinol methylase